MLVPVLVPAQGVDPDVSISPDDISFDPSDPFVGDEVIIKAVIRNSGGHANDVSVFFKLGNETIDVSVKPDVPASATAFGQWDTTGLSEGEYIITVKVVAQGDTNTTNDIASKVINLTRKPEAKLTITSLTVTPDTFVDGDLVEVTAEVENTGDADTTLDVKFDVEGTELGNKTLVLPKGSKKKANVTWDTDGMEGDQNLTVTAGAATKTLKVTVDHRPVAKFVVEKVWLSENEPLEKARVKVHTTITNQGDAPEIVTVVFKDNINLIEQKKDVTFLPYETKNLSAEWQAVKGTRVIRVEVDGHPDAVNFKEVDVIPITSRGCGRSIMALVLALVVGCVGLVKWKGKKRKDRV